MFSLFNTEITEPLIECSHIVALHKPISTYGNREGCTAMILRLRLSDFCRHAWAIALVIPAGVYLAGVSVAVVDSVTCQWHGQLGDNRRVCGRVWESSRECIRQLDKLIGLG